MVRIRTQSDLSFSPPCGSHDGGPGRTGKLTVTRHARTFLGIPSFASLPGSTRRPGSALYVLLALLGLGMTANAGQRVPAGPPAGLWGRTVAAVRLRADADLHLSDFPGAVVQQEGQPLDRGKVAASLKNLYATGRFAELTADDVAQDHTVQVSFIA